MRVRIFIGSLIASIAIIYASVVTQNPLLMLLSFPAGLLIGYLESHS